MQSRRLQSPDVGKTVIAGAVPSIAASQVRILDGKSATVLFGERTDRERVGMDEGLVNLHVSHLRC
jgi:hypothetical protein